ncbi:OLC1v1019312C1 [Oldenlandia corymbosa var. corymbosa]|uniref:OLC1v1019312C1 n=1 Tax=Oldenlandia corymbosa var. corymbosa TaxID=529605 RepID=A0AAV1EE57_OLDCO|nr:OLC1v1019312C1 [Oldenlandia corymbosa var. corymbosa]
MFSISSLLNAPTSETTTGKIFRIDYPMKSNRSFQPVGSCNGLVCFQTGENELFLCNPCIKSSLTLPNSGMEKPRCIFSNFGFGYDMSNDDCKVVGVFDFHHNRSYKIKVYSLKNNAWHTTEDFKRGVPCSSLVNVSIVSGKLYWLSSIGSFELADEIYRDMEPPNAEASVGHNGLGEIGGCLSVFYDNGRRHMGDGVLDQVL